MSPEREAELRKGIRARQAATDKPLKCDAAYEADVFVPLADYRTLWRDENDKLKAPKPASLTDSSKQEAK